MRLSHSAPAVSRLATATLLLSAASLVAAKPAKPQYIPFNMHMLDDRHAVDSRHATLVPRQGCAAPCGYGGWLCCGSVDQCYTDSNQQAGCNGAVATAGPDGHWQYFTSVWVETDTVTKTAVFSSWIGGGGVPANPTPAACGIPCGDNGGCCNSGEYCLIWASAQCAKATTPGVATPTGPSAPLRPTSSGLVVITATVSPTTTVPFESAIPTGVTPEPVAGGGGGLSGGAIAGIVIGVLAAIFFLFLLCLFCCARALFDTVMAIFGLGKKKKHTHESTYIEEHHHSGGGGGGRWYGQDRPSRPGKPEKSGLGGIAGWGAALGALALILGLKRKHDKKGEKSDYGSSYYSSDYTSSSSASSSDRRTRRTRDSRRSHGTRSSRRHSSRR